MKVNRKIVLVCITLFVGLGTLYNLFSFNGVKYVSYFDIGSLSTKVTEEDLSKYFNGNNGCFVFYDSNKDKYHIYNIKKSRQRIAAKADFDISGEVDEFWEGMFEISCIEQVELLRKLYAKDLPLSQEKMNFVKANMKVYDENNGVMSTMSKETKTGAMHMGWFEKRGSVYIFACNIEGEKFDVNTIREIAGKILMNKDIKIRTELKRNQRVLYEICGMDRVEIKRNIPYKVYDGDELKLNIYYPPKDSKINKSYTVIIIHGTNYHHRIDPKNSGRYDSWARLLAASGYTAITFDWTTDWIPTAARADVSTKKPEDISDLISYVRENESKLNIDTRHMSFIAYGTNVFAGDGTINAEDSVKEIISSNTGFVDSIVVYCGKMPMSILDDSSGNEKLPPILYVDGALDQFTIGLNDKFFKKAAESGYDITTLIHSKGPFLLDIEKDDFEAQKIIKETLNFIENHIKKTK